MGGVPKSDYCVRLGTFLALDDVKLHVIALFQSFVAVQLNSRVVDEHIGAVIATDESVALGVIEPLDFAFVLSHRLVPSLRLIEMTANEVWRGRSPYVVMTKKRPERLI
jgi:hypothetical protein